MRVVLLKKEWDGPLQEVERILRSGGIVVSPTDTVYGLLGDAANEIAIRKMFTLKQRPEEKAFPIFVRDIATGRQYAYVSDAKARFLQSIWPGQVTVLFDHKEKLPSVLTGGSEKIGMRVPNHLFLRELLARCDFPIAQTSANISGEPPAKNLNEIKKYFGDAKLQPDLVIDAGAITGGASVIIDLTQKDPMILRSGLMSKNELDDLLRSVLR